MKVTINIDCTPEEARAFLGLPDLGPLQREVMGQLRDRMMKAMADADPEALLEGIEGAAEPRAAEPAEGLLGAMGKEDQGHGGAEDERGRRARGGKRLGQAPGAEPRGCHCCAGE